MLITNFHQLLYYHSGAGRSFSICPTGIGTWRHKTAVKRSPVHDSDFSKHRGGATWRGVGNATNGNGRGRLIRFYER